MRFLTLACDYDGTLAHHGRVSARTVTALKSLLATGRRLILVTGRELGELLTVFPEMHLFEWVVAENGALLYCPATREEQVLAPAPPPAFVAALQARGVKPISLGRVIVATWQPHEATVLAAIRDLGLELQVIFNKGAVMVLPTSVSKATGLAAALKQMGLSPHEAVGVGDAENDHAFLTMCECSVAVANALPAVKQTADLQTRGDHGDGVAELIDQIVADDLRGLDGALARHHLVLGTRRDGAAVKLPPYGPAILIVGTSASGRSAVAAALLKQIAQQRYQFCVLDPGGLDAGHKAISVGDGREPTGKEIAEILVKGESSVAVSLAAVNVSDRSASLASLFPQLLELRARTGRPHWIVLNQAEHLLPAAERLAVPAEPESFQRSLLIAEHPEPMHPAALAGVGTVLVVGEQPERALAQVCGALGAAPPTWDPLTLAADEVLLWRKPENPLIVRLNAEGRPR